MKKIMTLAITALLVVGSTVVFATPDDRKELKNVDVTFQNGIGVQLLVTNHNDYPIYDVTLEMDTIGMNGRYAVVLYTIPRAITIDELAAGESGALNVFTFSLPGSLSVTATISYEINGQIMTQTATTTLFMFGFFTFVINS